MVIVMLPEEENHQQIVYKYTYMYILCIHMYVVLCCICGVWFVV